MYKSQSLSSSSLMSRQKNVYIPNVTVKSIIIGLHTSQNKKREFILLEISAKASEIR